MLNRTEEAEELYKVKTVVEDQEVDIGRCAVAMTAMIPNGGVDASSSSQVVSNSDSRIVNDNVATGSLVVGGQQQPLSNYSKAEGVDTLEEETLGGHAAENRADMLAEVLGWFYFTIAAFISWFALRFYLRYRRYRAKKVEAENGEAKDDETENVEAVSEEFSCKDTCCEALFCSKWTVFAFAAWCVFLIFLTLLITFSPDGLGSLSWATTEDGKAGGMENLILGLFVGIGAVPVFGFIIGCIASDRFRVQALKDLC